MAFPVQIAVIPTGTASDRLRLSVMMTPVIDDTTPATLGAWSSWADWPSRLQLFTFDVQINNGAYVRANAPFVAERALWERLLRRDLQTRVPSPFAQLTGPSANYEEFGGRHVTDEMTKAYQRAAGIVSTRLQQSTATIPLPFAEPLLDLGELQRSASDWRPWLAEGASSQQKAATQLLSRCIVRMFPMLDPVAVAAFWQDIRRISREPDRRLAVQDPRVLEHLSPMVIRGLLARHRLWGDISTCEERVSSPLAARAEFSPGMDDRARRAAEAALFHRLPHGQRGLGGAMSLEETLAALTQHPPLLPLLGLVVDLDVSLTEIEKTITPPTTLADGGLVRVR